ncbi:unnamed protein product, partial [Pocillopora meandrina]
MADSEDEPQEAKKAKVDRTSRSTYESVDWSICIFCQKKKYKGVKELISVASFDSCQAIVDAAIACDDQRLLLNIKGVDLIAKEAKYHGKCRSKYVRRAEENFECRDDCTTTQNVRELAWFLLRLNRKNVLKANDTYGEQSVSGWSAFNAEMSSITLPRTVIGYCPMIAGSPTEYSTIYTVLKTVQEMSKHLQQNTAVITFDLAIYSKEKEIHWCYPEEFQNLSATEQQQQLKRRKRPICCFVTPPTVNVIETFQVLGQVHRDDSPSPRMIPYFFAMDRMNYSRWLPVYIMDTRNLQEKALDVYNEFLRGNHTVSRSTSQSFNQVWTDMALEQSINLDSKAKGGIIGITQRPSALQKWFLTAHERTATTTATKRIIDLDESTRSTHKESSKVRVQRDENDIKKVIHTLQTVMSNPFDEDAYREDVPLMNLATGVVMPEEISEQLIDAQCLGEARMKLFVSKRINTNEVGFWEPMEKMNIKTFASLSKKAKVKSVDEKLVTVSADRNLFGRLLIASRSRDIDLREVLKYELDSVPCAL